MASGTPSFSSRLSAGIRPFRTAVLRGLAVVAPPLLTLVILLWIVRTVESYILDPILNVSGDVLADAMSDIRTQLPEAQPTADPTVFRSDDREFKRLDSGQYVPLSVYTA